MRAMKVVETVDANPCKMCGALTTGFYMLQTQSGTPLRYASLCEACAKQIESGPK